jgi:hypothetical protein
LDDATFADAALADAAKKNERKRKKRKEKKNTFSFSFPFHFFLFLSFFLKMDDGFNYCESPASRLANKTVILSFYWR